ncbi:MAG: SDR family oxidoreductase [Kordiimonadaceae bacterium]|nr:SDR family oxidoreductase [Kordiimonadaceae bacterium]MBT6032877.1 SDR family oxidoreductase [Kordiimonadaceae bacterium]
MKLFCFGLGYTARHLINRLSPSTWQFSGTHKSSGEIIFDGCNPLNNVEMLLKDVTHLLISIAPNSSGDDIVLHLHRKDIANMPNLKWVGYLSATSVYGDHAGKWVDEQTTPAPTDGRGKARLNAEQQWLSQKLPIHIFRLGGIYGPNRNQVDAVINSTAKKIIKQNHVFSRIHVDDIVSALIASMKNPNPGSIYNIVDDAPSSSADVLDYISSQLSLKPIKGIAIENADISAMMKSFYADNKKVSNAHTKRALNWAPQFPSYKQGYDDLLEQLD